MSRPVDIIKGESPTGGQANSMGMLVQTLVALFDALLGDSPCEWLRMEPDLAREKFDLIWKAAEGMHAVQVKHSKNDFTLSAVTKIAQEMDAGRSEAAPGEHCACKLVLVGYMARNLRDTKELHGVKIDCVNPHLRDLYALAAHRLDGFLQQEKIAAVNPVYRENLVRLLATRLLDASCTGETLKRGQVVGLLRSWIAAESDYATGALVSKIIGEGRLPQTAGRLFGRDDDLRKLEEAWNSPAIGVISFVALGGAGKTSLVKKWLETIEAKASQGGYRVYKYSFYTQGNEGREGQMSSDHFLRGALRHFHDASPDDEGSLENKGMRLASLIQSRRTLLFLDGLEPLQHAIDEAVGKVMDQGIHRLLLSLADCNPGLCVVTTRLKISDLEGHPKVRQETLDELSPKAGRELLRELGVDKGRDEQLEETVGKYAGHALALTLLGGYLARYHNGDINRQDRIPPLIYEPKHGGHARRVMNSYENLLRGRPALGLLYILGLFDRPASQEAINAVIDPARIPKRISERFLLDGIGVLNSDSTAGLHSSFPGAKGRAPIGVERVQLWLIKLRIGVGDAFRLVASHLAIRKMFAPLRRLTQNELDQAIYELRELRLIDQSGSSEPGTIDCHPFVRLHYGEVLRRKNRFVWQEAHSRLFEHYRSIAPDYPETIAEMEPLYAAVAHGCQAKRYLEAGLGVYLPRMLRGAVYSVNTLGLLARDLAMLTYFFEKQWEQPVRGLSEQEKATVLYWAGTLLTTLSRYDEGLKALEEAKRRYIKLGSWKGASSSARYISELRAGFGNLKVGLKEAEDSVRFADLIQKDYERVGSHAIMGHCLHQLGQWTAALGEFRAAEEALHRVDPQTEFLHSFWGYLYCELLLDLGRLSEVEQRAASALKLAADQRMFAMGKLLDAAIAELTLARAHLLIEQKSGSIDYRGTDEHLGKAMDGIRRVGHQWLVPQALFTGVEYQRLAGDVKKGAIFLGEARALIFQSGRAALKLYEADCLLSSVALHLSQQDIDNARTDLALAEEVVASAGYHRRKVQLHLYHAQLCQLEGAVDAAHRHLGKAKETVDLQGCHRWDFEIGEIERRLK